MLPGPAPAPSAPRLRPSPPTERAPRPVAQLEADAPVDATHPIGANSATGVSTSGGAPTHPRTSSVYCRQVMSPSATL